MTVQEILEKHKKVFETGIGKLTDIKGKLTMQDGVRPKFYKAREVAYSLRLRVEEELDRLQHEGVISPIGFSDWGNPNSTLTQGKRQNSTDEEHLQNLSLVLERLEQNGLRANLEKCEFFKDKISYCGHVIDKDGLHKSSDKINAVKNAPKPENVSQLRSFLGLLNYYHRFSPNLDTVVGPLNELLQNNRKWNWTSKCEGSFVKVKELITSEQVLCHCNPYLPVCLATDASSYGIGAILSHDFEDGAKRPMEFASRSLTKAEKGYSQIDKEALGIYWGVKKFHNYLYGRRFTLITDHKPPVSIFHPKKSLPTMTTARLQRYAIFLSSYSIEYRKTANHGNADGLSRLPLTSSTTDTTDDDIDTIYYSSQFESLPGSCDHVRKETQRDPILSQVLGIVLHGTGDFPAGNEFKPYRNRRNELTVHQNCLLWGNRVIIPTALQREVLSELHRSHTGIVRTRSLARSHVWWPNIDTDIEAMCQSCSDCQHYLPKPEPALVHLWEWTNLPWERIHVDFAGPFKGRMYVIAVDSHSKWLEVVPMSSTTSTAKVNILRDIFSRLGLPSTFVSDNGPQFIADEFKASLRQNGVKHVTSSPYHLRTNGLAERIVRSFKTAMKKYNKVTNKEINSFLMTYRITPHATTGKTPAKLLIGRNLRTRLDLLKPDTSDRVRQKQDNMKLSRHTGSNVRIFTNGQSVMVRDTEDKHRGFMLLL
ncbi:uncharacterized protein K02A2.6-like [Saccostrea echinata]|uniref:uncharacterized protein K02A2.6-like n=1 Tax=Saccostrea echinata TaxID=191078 RepID=UPI002A808BC7|nr:uncharacterized protein K02A2.6-like [Saccostrea echinata]